MKFKAHIKRTNNDCVTNLYIKETIFDDDADGYVQIINKTVVHQLVIEGHNSYRRAELLAEQINNPRQK